VHIAPVHGPLPVRRPLPGGSGLRCPAVPKASGFPEDVATGVAATALAFGLVAYGLISCDGKRLTVRQGRAMGRPSEIFVRFDLQGIGSQPKGCFLGGRTVLTAGPR